jgi:hypothetical protein
MSWDLPCVTPMVLCDRTGVPFRVRRVAAGTDNVADSTCWSYVVLFDRKGKHRNIATLMYADMYSWIWILMTCV